MVTNDTLVSNISTRGIIGLGATVLVLLIYCCFAFVVAMKELLRMKKPRMEENGNLSDSIGETDDEKQASEIYTNSGKSKQAHSKSVDDLLLINENTIEQNIDTESDSMAIVTLGQPFSTVHKSNCNNQEHKKLGKPFFGSKQQKKVQFVINLSST